MPSLREHMQEYRKQLQAGVIQQAYRGLMQYMLDLRTHFAKEHPDMAPGNTYFGYMDMTYFPLFPAALKERKLKIAIVFLHEACRFEVWLSANNKQVQGAYLTLFKESGWDKHRLVPTAQGYDSIVESVVADNPDWGNLPALTAQIEEGTLAFIQDVEGFLARYPNHG